MMEEANYDFCSDINETTGETCIHLACKNSSDIQILESLLLKLRSQLSGSKEAIKDFLDITNYDGLKALDYCVFKRRHDMAVVLQEFVDSSQQIVDIKSYNLKSDYPTNSANITNCDAYQATLR